MNAADGATVNITRTIDDGPITAFQVVAIVLCSLVAFLDGLDTQSIAVAAPAIAGAIGLQRSALGSVFAAGLMGAMLGALTFGPLGDRFGRRRLLIGSAVLFGVFTILTAYCHSYAAVLAVRFCAGIGLGGAVPCYLTLSAEYAPKRRRAMIASLIWAAFPLGGALGGFVNAGILRAFGWQALFLIGGTLPLIVAVVLMAWLPESIRYMVATGASPQRISAIVRRMRPDAPIAVRYVTDEERASELPLTQLFRDGRASSTLLLWVPFITGFGILGITVLWTPILLQNNGVALDEASFVLGVHGIGALIGMSVAGRLIEQFGAFAILVPGFLVGAVLVATLGYAAGSVPTMATVLFLIGMFVGVGASGSIAVAALTYPTAMRSSGIGWAMGMGRFGQVLAPLLATAIIAAGWTDVQLFLLFAVAPILGAAAILTLHRKSVLATEPS